MVIRGNALDERFVTWYPTRMEESTLRKVMSDLGKMSADARFGNCSKEQISKAMRKVRLASLAKKAAKKPCRMR